MGPWEVGPWEEVREFHEVREIQEFRGCLAVPGCPVVPGCLGVPACLEAPECMRVTGCLEVLECLEGPRCREARCTWGQGSTPPGESACFPRPRRPPRLILQAQAPGAAGARRCCQRRQTWAVEWRGALAWVWPGKRVM